ncbi:MAG: sortase [Actinomycetota bacterium]|jgi:sortase A|nr:sortase [Actinomycetota bacterium]
MSPGDPVVVETADDYHVYTFERTRVVTPEQTEVLAAVPDDPSAEPAQAWMVITACHPKFSAAERLIGYALLDRTVPREAGPPAELSGDR